MQVLGQLVPIEIIPSSSQRALSTVIAEGINGLGFPSQNIYKASKSIYILKKKTERQRKENKQKTERIDGTQRRPGNT